MMDDPRSSPIVWIPLVVGLCWAGGCGTAETSPRAILRGHTGDVTSLAFAPDGRSLASRSSDDTVRIWDVPLGRERMAIKGFPSEMGAVVFSPDGARLAANEVSVGAVTWDAATGDRQSNYPDPERAEPAWSCYSVACGWGIAYSPDGKLLAGGGSNGGESGFVALWDVASGKGEDLGCHEGPVTAVAFAPGGGVLASAGLEGSIRLWDLATRRERACLRGHTAPVYAIAYSPDGRTVVSASLDHSVGIWDTASGHRVGTFSGHRHAVLCVALSRDGRVAASGDHSGAVLLWDPSTRKTTARLVRHQGAVLGVAFSPVADLLASGGRDGEIRLWDLPRRREAP